MKNQWLGFALFALAASGAVLAGDFGTAAEARTMLDRVVAAMKADQAQALAELEVRVALEGAAGDVEHQLAARVEG